LTVESFVLFARCFGVEFATAREAFRGAFRELSIENYSVEFWHEMNCFFGYSSSVLKASFKVFLELISLH
jgi:hypothetical protein